MAGEYNQIKCKASDLLLYILCYDLSRYNMNWQFWIAAKIMTLCNDVKDGIFHLVLCVDFTYKFLPQQQLFFRLNLTRLMIYVIAQNKVALEITDHFISVL